MQNNIAQALNELASYEIAKREKGFQFKMVQYRKAAKLFRDVPTNVKSMTNVNRVLSASFKNPTAIRTKIKELVETGKIEYLQKQKNDPVIQAIKVLSSIPQVGPAKARELIVKHDITSVPQLKQYVKKQPGILNSKQLIGLSYYDALINPKTLSLKRIPRKDIVEFEKDLSKLSIKFDICGSFRRGLPDSGDIDVLFDCTAKEFKNVVLQLTDKGVLKEHFSSGSTKWMGIGLVNGSFRRIDFMRVSSSEYPFALMYFTGSKDFNEAFRGHARKQEFTLNEHGIFSLKNGSIPKYEFKSERDIFKFLSVRYHSPDERNLGKFSISADKSKNSPKNSKSHTPIFDVSKGVLLASVYKEDVDPVGYIASEKLDGVRAVWNGSTLRSRTDKQFYPPSWFIENLPKEVALDGELFIDRNSFQKTTSVVMKKSPVEDEWKLIKFMVFDIPSSKQPFETRLEILEQIAKTTPYVKFVKHTVVKSRSHMKSLYDDVIGKGGEGIMLRKPGSLYQQKRSKDLLKVKPTDDDEAIITGFQEGKGKDSGSLGALEVYLLKNKNIKFKIGTGFTAALRRKYWNNQNNILGQTVTFGHKGWTNKGIPRHPAFMRFRYNLQK